MVFLTLYILFGLTKTLFINTANPTTNDSHFEAYVYLRVVSLIITTILDKPDT
jgi:hypothetical protein